MQNNEYNLRMILRIICYAIYIRKMLKVVDAHTFKLIDKRFAVAQLMFLLQLF